MKTTSYQSSWRRTSIVLMALFAFVSLGKPGAAQSKDDFKPLFNGQDLDGWHAMPLIDPVKHAALSENAKKELLDSWQSDARKYWKVDSGQLVNTATSAYLSTAKEFADVELLVEYRMAPKTNGGIFLRGTAPVRIWDTTKQGGKWDYGARGGSGGLSSNSFNSRGRLPLVRADKPFGEWNSLRIIQVGERTSVWLNGKLVVDHARMEDPYSRQLALPGLLPTRMLPLPKKGPVQLHVAAGEIRWRNLQVREISGDEANENLRKQSRGGFVDMFNGKDFAGWAGPIENYEVKEGAIVCKPKKGGTIYTKDQYGDFVARVDFKLPPAGNNGLAIRYPGRGDTAYEGMCEIQVLDDTAATYAKLDPRQYNGSAYGMTASHRGYLRPVGEWNFEEVTVVGSTIKVELNGTVILDTDLSKITQFMANRAHPGKDRKAGHFGFAGHNDPVAFRNIQIKDLAAKVPGQ